MMRTIITSNVYPPIPIRAFDWCAYFDGDEESPNRYGWGATEAEAIADLHQNIDEPEEPEIEADDCGEFGEEAA